MVWLVADCGLLPYLSLIHISVGCIGVKEATAKKKASALFKKYNEIIAWSKRDNDYYKEQYLSLIHI